MDMSARSDILDILDSPVQVMDMSTESHILDIPDTA